MIPVKSKAALKPKKKKSKSTLVNSENVKENFESILEPNSNESSSRDSGRIERPHPKHILVSSFPSFITER